MTGAVRGLSQAGSGYSDAANAALRENVPGVPGFGIPAPIRPSSSDRIH